MSFYWFYESLQREVMGLAKKKNSIRQYYVVMGFAPRRVHFFRF